MTADCENAVWQSLGIVDHLRRRFGHFNLGAHLLNLRRLVFELRRQWINPFFLFLHFAVFFEGRGLRHNGQGEIVAVAAFIAHMVSVAANNQGRAVRQIAEGASDRGRGGVADDREGCAAAEVW